MSTTKKRAKSRKPVTQKLNIKSLTINGKAVNPTLPPEGFVRLPTVLAVFGTSKSTLWRWVAEKRFPAPLKLGPGTSAWDVASLREHMAHIRGGAA